MIEILLWALCLGAALPVAALAIECAVGVMPVRRRDAERTDAPPPFVVLMPAHDEAADIERHVGAVVAQLRPCDRLLVVADNCTDDTAAIAARMGALVIERQNPAQRGKSYALQFGRDHLACDPQYAPMDVVILVDADCSPHAGALQRLAATAIGRDAAVQGAYLLHPPPRATPIVQISCFAFLVKNLVRQIALRRLAGVALLQGSGMAFPRRMFEPIDWSRDSLVEDLDMGVRLVLGGEVVTFDEHALFLSYASSQRGTVDQRRRWEHGMLQSMRSVVPPLLRAALAGRTRLIFLALDQIIPPTVMLLTMAGAITAIALLLGGWTGPVQILLACDMAMGAGLLAAWMAHGRAILPWRSITASLRYILWKLPILAQFVTRRQTRWVRTDRAP